MDLCLDDDLILDYLNGLLSEEARTLLEKHLAACPECRLEIVEFRKTAAAVTELRPPSVPAAWTTAAKKRLQTETAALVAAFPVSPAPTPGTTNVFQYVFQYAVSAAGVTAGLVLLFWLVISGTVQHWLPGLSTTALGISEFRAARTVNLVAWILSLHALLLVPSIIDDIYRLVHRGGRKSGRGSSAGFLAC
jgi:anti-sigma factor RsiW